MNKSSTRQGYAECRTFQRDAQVVVEAVLPEKRNLVGVLVREREVAVPRDDEGIQACIQAERQPPRQLVLFDRLFSLAGLFTLLLNG